MQRCDVIWQLVTSQAVMRAPSHLFPATQDHPKCSQPLSSTPDTPLTTQQSHYVPESTVSTLTRRFHARAGVCQQDVSAAQVDQCLSVLPPIHTSLPSPSQSHLSTLHVTSPSAHPQSIQVLQVSSSMSATRHPPTGGGGCMLSESSHTQLCQQAVAV